MGHHGEITIFAMGHQGQSHPPTLGRPQGGSADSPKIGDTVHTPIFMAKFMTIMIRNDDNDDLNIKRW
jgi:hypothetical protein